MKKIIKKLNKTKNEIFSTSHDRRLNSQLLKLELLVVWRLTSGAIEFVKENQMFAFLSYDK